jgi:iron complex transport system substrate-binding protein
MPIRQNEPMRRAFVLSLLTAIFVAGCKDSTERVAFPVREKRYVTVASLSPGSTEVVASLAYSLKLVGRTAACNFPAHAVTAPIVAQVKPDYEKLKAQNPSLVVFDGDLYNDQDKAQIKALGIDTFEFKAKTVDEYAREILKFGALTGIEMEASAFADKLTTERKAAMSDPISPAPKVALILPGKNGQHLIAGTKGFQADVLRAAGGEPVGPDQDKYVPIDAEALLQLNPDMIITGGKPELLMADPRLKSLPAVAKLKMRGISQDMVTRMGYRVDKEINMIHRALRDMAGSN